MSCFQQGEYQPGVTFLADIWSVARTQYHWDALTCLLAMKGGYSGCKGSVHSCGQGLLIKPRRFGDLIAIRQCSHNDYYLLTRNKLLCYHRQHFQHNKTNTGDYCIPFVDSRIPSWIATACKTACQHGRIGEHITIPTSSTHGNWKNSLRLSSSCRTVMPSLGPLPKIVSRSRDCDSIHVCTNCAGSSANDWRNARFRWELLRDWARREIFKCERSTADRPERNKTNAPLHPSYLEREHFLCWR
jgi:hypothetical protein